jgi:hypothetical protein
MFDQWVPACAGTTSRYFQGSLMTEAKISLGGRDFAIEPLKLGQLRGLLDALDDLSGKTGGAVIDAAARVIQAGLVRTTPEMSLDDVFELEATMDEVTAAVSVILGVAGLSRPAEMKLEEIKSGEAVPVAATQGEPAAVSS